MGSGPVPNTAGWNGLELEHRIDEGNRGEVWRARLADGHPVAVRRSGRSPASLDWELDLITDLDAAGIVVPTVVPTIDGRRHVDGLVVQRWIDGRAPSTEADWHAVAAALQHLHAATGERPQRPGCSTVTELGSTGRSVDADIGALPAEVATLVRSVFAEFATAPTAVVHGDPNPSNLRITADGRVGLLDFDESRVDCTWHDLSNLGVQVLDDAQHALAQRLSHAWEAANAWTVEPDYARRRLAQLH